MDTLKLKDKILQLAIQGKLVDQDPNDEPASELLKKIEAEKKKLYREGKIRKPKKLPPIKEEEKPFEIPESWEWVRLGEIIEVGSSRRVMKSEWKSEGIPFYRAREIVKLSKEGFVENELFISEKHFKSLKENNGIPKKHDLMVTGVGTIGVSYVVKEKDKFYFKDASVLWFNNYSNIDPYYIKNYLASDSTRDRILNSSMGTTVKTLTITGSKNIVIPLPPLNEQKRIVEKIDGLFKLIDNLDSDKEKLIDTIELIRNKVLQDAIQGKLVEQDSNDEPASELLKKIEAEKKKLYKEGKIRKPKKLPVIKEEEKPFDIPESWEWVKFGNVVDFKIGKTPKRSENKYWENGIYPWISISDLEEGKVIHKTEEKVSEKAFHEIFKENISPKGTLVMSFKLTIGKMSILGKDSFHNEAIISIFPYLDSNYILRNYLFKIFKGLDILMDSKKAVKGSTLNTTSMNNIILPFPPSEEQKRITEKIDIIFNYCDLLEELVRD